MTNLFTIKAKLFLYDGHPVNILIDNYNSISWINGNLPLYIFNNEKN